jgi:hypothetical protein
VYYTELNIIGNAQDKFGDPEAVTQPSGRRCVDIREPENQKAIARNFAE